MGKIRGTRSIASQIRSHCLIQPVLKEFLREAQVAVAVLATPKIPDLQQVEPADLGKARVFTAIAHNFRYDEVPPTPDSSWGGRR